MAVQMQQTRGLAVVVALVASIALVLPGAQAATAPNLVVNSTMEAGTAGWMAGPSTTLSPAPSGHAGFKSARATRVGSIGSIILNDTKNTVTSTVAGHTYRATMWARASNTNAYAAIRMMEYSTSNVLRGQDKAGATLTAGAWTRVTVDYVAVTSGASIDLNLLGYSVAGKAYIDYDDITLVDQTLADQVVTPPAWKLVWSDEFNGTALDTTKWNALDNSTYGAGNNELACIKSRSSNVSVQAGTLRLTALKEATPITCQNTTRDYTSGHLNTQGKASFTYGKFEVRAKLPLAPGSSKGIWPAFWMRPVDGGTGEIDILEAIGTNPSETANVGRMSQTLWYDYIGTYPKYVNVFKAQFDPSTAFHTYAVEWEPGSVKWLVDGVVVHTVTSQTLPWMTSALSKPFILRLNLAVGGDWPGAPDATTVFPATYEVDYVRVYQR